MTYLIVTADRVAELNSINAQHSDRQCTFNLDVNGVRLTSSDKLADAYWADYHAFLGGLDPFEGELEWPVTEDE
jgi:uncharacterized protein (UPF0276 family)